MNDRYLYISLVGFFLAILLIADQMTGKLFSDPKAVKRKIVLTILMTLFIIPFARQTMARVEDWKHPVGIYEAGMKGLSVGDSRMRIGRAMDLYAKQDIKASIAEIEKALEFGVGEELLLWQVQNFLAIGDFEKALAYLHRIEQLPGWAKTGAYHDFYGQYYEHKEQFDVAEKHYMESIQIDKKMPAYLHLAQLYLRMGKYDKAADTYETALKIDPDSDDVLVEACKLYLDLQNYARAYELYQRLLRLYPNDPFVLEVSKLVQRHKE